MRLLRVREWRRSVAVNGRRIAICRHSVHGYELIVFLERSDASRIALFEWTVPAPGGHPAYHRMLDGNPSNVILLLLSLQTQDISPQR